MRNYGLKKELVEILIIQWVPYDSAKISELVGCLLLYKLDGIIDPGCHGLYCDDGLIMIDKCTPRKGDIIRKKLHWLFDKFGFKLDIQADLKITDYLDVMFNLYDGTMSPFRKNDQYPCYINVGSNHPRKVFKQIPNSFTIRLSTNSSNEDIFPQNKQDYEIALKNSGYKEKLLYKSKDDYTNVLNRSNNRKRKILWFTSPYNISCTHKNRKRIFLNIRKKFSEDK